MSNEPAFFGVKPQNEDLLSSIITPIDWCHEQRKQQTFMKAYKFTIGDFLDIIRTGPYRTNMSQPTLPVPPRLYRASQA